MRFEPDEIVVLDFRIHRSAVRFGKIGHPSVVRARTKLAMGPHAGAVRGP
jgi:hypothetical protein